jgi:hypothetical protein
VTIDLPDTSIPAGIDQALDAIIAAMGRGELTASEGQSFVAVIEARQGGFAEAGMGGLY